MSGGHSSSRCAGLSLSWPLLLRSRGSRRSGSVVVAHGPSRSAARGIFPDQGSNPCPPHWQADSQPLRHQGSPVPAAFKIKIRDSVTRPARPRRAWLGLPLLLVSSVSPTLLQLTDLHTCHALPTGSLPRLPLHLECSFLPLFPSKIFLKKPLKCLEFMGDKRFFKQQQQQKTRVTKDNYLPSCSRAQTCRSGRRSDPPFCSSAFSKPRSTAPSSGL